MASVLGLQGSESKTCASLRTGQVAPVLRDRAGGGGGHAPCLGLTQPSPGSTQRPRARPAEGRATSSPTFRLPKLSSRRAPPPPRTPSPRAHRQESKEDGRSELGQARAPRPAPRMEPDPSCSRSAGPGTRDPEPTAPPRGRRSSHQAPTSPGADETRPRLPRREKWGTAVERGSRDPAWSNNRTRSAGRERVGEETGSRRKPQSRPPSPSWWNRPATASCPGSASQLQPQEKSETQGPDARPGIPRPGPAIPQRRTPPYPDAALRSSLAAGTPSSFSVSRRPQHPPPPSRRFQIEIPWLRPSEDSARQPRPLAAEAPPAPPPDAHRVRKPPRAATRPLCPGHAPAPIRATLPEGFAARPGRVPCAGRTRLALAAALDNEC